MKVYRRYAPGRDVVLYRGDCMRLLEKLPSDSVDLTLTSPPYCMGKEYDSCRDVDSFVSNHQKVLPRIINVTKPGGSICWQIGYHVKNNTVTPLDFLVHEIMRDHPEMVLRNRIIWSFGHGAHLNHRFSGRHEVILWYTKGDSHHFDLDSVRVPQKYPGKRHYKGPSKGEYSGNPLGKNPSDVWDIPHVKANHVEKTEHPCQFPVALAHRLVRALSPVGGTVFDPYTGSGTTGVASILEGRSFIGAELDQDYCEISEKRLKMTSNGTLRFRSAEKPIYVPKGDDVVSKKPSHFA